MTMGDRVAVLKGGKLQQFASPTELYDRPANAFVAGFIGSPGMNLVTAPVSSGGVRFGDVEVPLDREQMAAIAAAGLASVTVGIRPEQFQVVAAGDGIAAQIDLVEELGNESYIYAHVPGTEATRSRSLHAPAGDRSCSTARRWASSGWTALFTSSTRLRASVWVAESHHNRDLLGTRTRSCRAGHIHLRLVRRLGSTDE